MPVVSNKDCQEADEFLELLSTRGELFGSSESVLYSAKSDAWLFRGHADDEFVLKPSALRPAAFSKLGIESCPNNESQIEAEARYLHWFFNLADGTGLPLPEDSQALRDQLRKVTSKTYRDAVNAGQASWPPEMLWSLLGLGQHYGLPTRLMDWSRKALVAAYFAAEGAVGKLSHTDSDDERKRLKKGKKLTVWAFQFDRWAALFDREMAAFFHQPAPPDLPAIKVTAPRAHNPNLHAQDGLFTLQFQNLKNKLGKPVDSRPIDQLVGKFLRDHQPEFADGTFFYRIRLPWKHADHLLWRLHQEGLSAATIYPGYKGVVLAMQEAARYPVF
jgi:hypothetical protein